MNKAKIIQQACEIAESNAKLLHWKVEAACLLYAMAVCEVLNEKGTRCILQAGSAFWRRLPEKEDDGVVNTHFGYDWEHADPIITKQRLGMGMLPEMHVWAACPSEKMLIDASTKHLAVQCLDRTGMEWRTPPPPDFFWMQEDDEWPENDVHYMPCVAACKISLVIARRTQSLLEELRA